MSDRIAVTLSAGRRIPGSVPRVALVVVTAVAYAVAPPVPASLAVGLAILAALFPAFPAAWGAILVVALAQLANPAQATDWRLYVALALVHLIHVLASLATAVDPRGTMQVRMLVLPMRRWIAIQVPAQLVLAGALLATAGLSGASAGFAPVLAAAGTAVAIGLTVRLALGRRG